MTLKQRIQYYMETAMPILDYKYLGDKNSYYTIDDTSRRIATSPGFDTKLRRFWSNSRYPVNVWIMNVKDKVQRESVMGYGKMELSKIEQKLPSLYKYIENNIEITKKSINIIIAGDVKKADPDVFYQLSPWIVGHRLAHSVFSSHGTLIDKQTIMLKLLAPIHNSYTGPVLVDYMSRRGLRQCQLLFTFKSARNDKIDNFDELMYEVFAEWVIKGRVKLDIPDQINGIPIKEGINKNKLITDFNKKIGKFFSERLDPLLGEFLFD